jgi:hypothetical protein
MNHVTRIRIASAFTVAAFTPMISSALTVDELQAQIKSLMSQLQTLQQQLHQQVASTSPAGAPRGDGRDEGHPCIALGRTLSQGMQGDDVRELQQKLIDDGDLDASSSPTGFFGSMTMQAVHKMQKRFGIASTTGVVGPQTRDLLKKGCATMMGNLSQASSTPWTAQREGDDHGMKGMMPTTTIPMQMHFDGQKGLPGQSNRGPEGMPELVGTITVVGSDSITVQDRSGSKTLAITSTTVIRVWNGTSTPMVAGTTADLAVGDKVAVHGAKQADGTFAAVLVQKGLPMPAPKQGGMMPGFMRGGDNY